MNKRECSTNWEDLKSGKLPVSIFKLRAEILNATRIFFQQEGYLEIEAPLLTPYPTLDANISPVPVNYDTGTGESLSLFLHSSPEHVMKKLLATGEKKIVSIGKVFRNGEQTQYHNGEFTMVEWYRTDSDYQDVIRDTECLIQFILQRCFNTDMLNYQCTALNLGKVWKQSSICELFQKYVDIDLSLHPSLEELRTSAQTADVHTTDDDDWNTTWFRIFLQKIEPYIGVDAPEWIIDYPVSMGLMAQRKHDHSDFVERAELYIGGMELANGYSELIDANEQLQRFEVDKNIKLCQTGIDYIIDRELIKALGTGLPPCAGMALGLDRLIMLLMDKSDIQDVILFPIHQMGGKK